MKEIIITILLSTGFLGMEACTCDDIIPFWNITDYKISISDPFYNPPNNGVIDTDTLLIKLDFDTEFLTHQCPGLFTNSAFATPKCPENGDEGMKDLLTGFGVVTDSLFNNFQPGESLNSIIMINGTISVEDWIQSMHYADHYQTITLSITEKPRDIRNHRFKINMSFASGRVIEKESEMITWN